MQTFIIVLAGMLLSAACGKKSDSNTSTPAGADTSFTNPLLPSGPDPWVEEKDTMYYYMNTLGDRLGVFATNKMSALAQAKETTVWTPPGTGLYSKEIWAPEIHFIQNRWFIYFAADDGNNLNHRIYAVECDDEDPVKGAWTFKGKIADSTSDFWAIDASVFTWQNQLYMIWSGWPGTANVEQDIYIAKMKDPLTIDGKRVLISSPVNDWEKMGAPPAVNEGPEALISPAGRLFLTFSASGCWTDHYALGLLTLKTGGDPMTATDWTKSAAPVFESKPENGAYAPGHNGFFKSRDGAENWLLYHANPAAGLGCSNSRSPRMQKFTWNGDGTPGFGTPVPIAVPIKKPGGE